MKHSARRITRASGGNKTPYKSNGASGHIARRGNCNASGRGAEACIGARSFEGSSVCNASAMIAERRRAAEIRPLMARMDKRPAP